MDYEITYAHTVDDGAKLVERIRSLETRGGTKNLGFDTEFYDVRVGKESTVARAKVHFASLAWLEPGARLHPRGYYIPCAAVVSRDVVVGCGPFRELFLDPRFCWYAHNAPVDAHSFKNEGIEIKRVVNTLTVARWVHPGRARAQYGGGGFTLDALAQDLLGQEKTDAYGDIFTERVEEWREVTRVTRHCGCGVLGCRLRSVKNGHSKYTREETLREPVYVEREVPLREVVPGHPLFERAKRYSAQDAVLAHCLAQVLLREMDRQERVVPWIPKRLGLNST